MPRFQRPEAYGPAADLGDAAVRAREVADRLGMAVNVYRIGGARDGSGAAYELRAAVDPPPSPEGDTPVVLHKRVEPDPLNAPFQRWPLVELYATTDRAQRDVRVAHWRHENRRRARLADEPQPYGVRVLTRTARVAGLRVDLHVVVVRSNPKYRP